jgi:hypothetical protein
MRTFLEYLLAKYLGKPTSARGNGVSYWPCPVCEHGSFHTMPVHPKYKHWAKCFRCGFLEDAAGLLREFHSGAYPGWQHLPDYSDRIELLDALTERWNRDEAAEYASHAEM